jgi:predicted DNA-binding transcriptional regulator YafY
VDRLRELGYPVDAHRGVDGGYQLAAGAALPPLVLDDEEAVALVIGLRAAAQGAIAGIEESSVRALAKVVQVMPSRLRRRVDALRTATVPAVWSTGPTVDPGALTAVAQACRDEERLRFSYTARAGQRTQRHVEPHRLVSLGRRWYLVAYDLTRHDWRSFRLDRLEDPCGTEARFRPRGLPAGDAVAFVRAGIDSVPAAPHTVEAVVHAPAATVRAMVGQWATVEELDDRRSLLRMTADSLDWPTMALGAVGAEFEVVRPPELADHIRGWAARFTRATSP